MLYTLRHAIESSLSPFCNAPPWPVTTGPFYLRYWVRWDVMAPPKITGICEEFPKINTHFPRMHRSSPRASYPTADYVGLRRVEILLVRIPKGHPDPKIPRIGLLPSYPAAGCPTDSQLCQLPRSVILYPPGNSSITMATEELCSIQIVGMYYRMLFTMAYTYFSDSCYP
jgi:hypothetical protein